VPQVSPLDTHCDVVGSQQPVVHALPAQHASPGLPHTLASATSSGASKGASDAASPPSGAIPSGAVWSRPAESDSMPSGVPSIVVLSFIAELSMGVVPSPVIEPSPSPSPEVASAGPVAKTE